MYVLMKSDLSCGLCSSACTLVGSGQEPREKLWHPTAPSDTQHLTLTSG